MAVNVNRRTFIGAASMAGLTGLALLGGCAGSGGGSASAGASAASQSASAQGASQSTGAQASGAGTASNAKQLTIGTLATEDILPLWVAREQGMFGESAPSVEIVTFQSATELIAGVASGEVDLAMTDIMVTASMFASGVDVQMQWVTLGTEPGQGRFGIMVGPNGTAQKLTDLAGVPIGVGSNTILEYVMDKLMENAGVPDDQIKVEELQKLPVRYQAMASGEVAAAALPGTLLALGEANGCKLVADDTTGENLSQSVMIVRAELLSDPAVVEQIAQLEDVWDAAAKEVNANPEDYRTVLVDNANLPSEIADSYPISTYPLVQLPTAAMVDPVLDWMKGKGYLTRALTYDEKTGTFSAA